MGGFQADSAQALIIKWTHVDNTGGPDAGGSARRTVVVNKVGVPVDIEDSWFTNGQDDLMGLFGAKITFLETPLVHPAVLMGKALI